MTKTSKDELSPQISDASLLKYLDGEANSAEAQTIDASEEMLQRSQQLASEQKMWQSALYRVQCPSSITLGEFNLQLLSHAEKRTVEAHVDTCPLCTGELAEMKSFMGETAQNKLKEILESGKRIVAELLETPIGEAAMQTRGAGLGTRIYIAGGLQFSLSAQPDPSDEKLKSIIGLATGEEADRMVAHLVHEGNSIQISEVDELGNFRFGGLDQGVFDVFVRGEDVTVEIGSFQV
jgi:hypothetical protein